MTVTLRPRGRAPYALPVAAWSAQATHSERELLAALDGPVIDLGCGPGRLVMELAEQGKVVLGVDASPVATEQALERGGPVLCRSVFDPVPGEGRWRCVLLLDGNIGIGGDPVALLRRARALACSDGIVVVETGAPGTGTWLSEARVEVTGEPPGPWFPWACLSADDLATYAREAGLLLVDWPRDGDRWIARLMPVESR